MFFALSADPQQLPRSTRKRGHARVYARVFAKIIDLVVVVALAALLPYPLGPLLGFLYSVFGDGFNRAGFHGQSVGKRLMGLRVVSTSRGPAESASASASANFRDSAFRNAPVGVATFFAIIPLWGWLILVLIGLPLMAMEIYLMVTVESGRRLGDVMGDTEVIEVKPEVSV